MGWLLLTMAGLGAEFLVIVVLGQQVTSRYEAEQDEKGPLVVTTTSSPEPPLRAAVERQSSVSGAPARRPAG